VDEVDPGAVDLRPVLLELVQFRLLGAPVVPVPPVVYEVPEVAGVRAVVPPSSVDRIRPSRPTEPLPEVVEEGRRDLAPVELNRRRSPP